MADITQICTICGKKFLVIEVEQEFLKKKGLPLPAICPSDRQAARLKNRGERSLYRTTCQNCGAGVITSYNPEGIASKILCKKCYADYFDKTEVLKS